MSKPPNEVVQVKFRASEGLRSRLEEISAKRATSMNAEIVDRLERSLDGDIDDQTAASFGRAVAFAMRDAGRLAAFHSKRTIEGSIRWYDDPFAYDQAIKAASALLSALRPAGDPVGPEEGAGAEFLSNIGVGTANALLDEIARGISRTGEKQRAAFLRRDLGEVAARVENSSATRSPLYVDALSEGADRGTVVLSNPTTSTRGSTK